MMKAITSSTSWCLVTGFQICCVLVQYFHTVWHQLNISKISLLCVTATSNFVFNGFLMKSLSCSPLEEHEKREKMLKKLELMKKKKSHQQITVWTLNTLPSFAWWPSMDLKSEGSEHTIIQNLVLLRCSHPFYVP